MRTSILLLVAMVAGGCGPQMTADAGVRAEFVCDPNAAEVTLAGSVQAQLFDNPCKSCHNAQDAQKGDFSDASRTAAATVNVDTISYAPMKRVVPGDLTRSVMWLKVNQLRGPNNERVGGIMPPTGPLSDEKKKLLKDWICSGAK